jgi:outer membrane lipoprotein carrier protein
MCLLWQYFKIPHVLQCIMKIKAHNILFLIVLFFPTLVMAADACQDLPNILDKIHTMQADFVQVVKNSTGVGQQSKGMMILQRPGKFRWEIFNPSHQLIIANDFNILTYDSDLKQLSRQKISYKQADNPVALLSGSVSELQKKFIIKKQLSKKESGDYFELHPKIKDSMFQLVTMHFASGRLDFMRILDNLGQQTDIEFINIKINIPLDRKVFVFTPPKGVDII